MTFIFAQNRSNFKVFTIFRNHAVTPQEMIIMALHFYATGSFLQVVSDFCGVDKGTTSIWKVTRAIAELYPHFINMPLTNAEIRATSQKFYNKTRFLKCNGALDCTHVKIISPGGDYAEIYRNRKGFFLIMFKQYVMLIVCLKMLCVGGQVQRMILKYFGTRL